MSGGGSRGHTTSPNNGLAQGAGETVPLTPNENFEGRPHPSEPDHFPRELRQNAAYIKAKQPYTADQLDRAAAEVERLRAVLESLTTDPPATLDEPDTDAEVIVKMRRTIRAALAYSRSGSAT